MPRHTIARRWQYVLLILWCYFASRAAGQCVMVNRDGVTGSDTGVLSVSGVSTEDDCKTHCLANAECAAAEFRFGLFCVKWNDNPPTEIADAGSTLFVKECSADPSSSSVIPSEGTSTVGQSTTSQTTITAADMATSSSIILQPSETSLAAQITSTFSSTSSTATVFCAHGVTDITETVDYLELDGGVTIADTVFTDQGWTSVGGDTLTIRFTGNGEKTLQQLSFIIKNGDGTKIAVLIEPSPGQFEVQDVDITSDEQLYVRNFNTPFVSISISTSETISNLILKVCNENPGDGATSPTPVLQTSLATQIIETTNTPVMSSTSEISTSSAVSPTATKSVSVSSIAPSCTMTEMSDSDYTSSNAATEYTIDGAETCLSLCLQTEQCRHVIHIAGINTCKFYDTSSITSSYQVDHTLYSKQSCPTGELCCFDIDTNASSADEAALTLNPTAEACKELCLIVDDCIASVFTGHTCKVVSTAGATMARENTTLFLKDCPLNVHSPFTRTDVCSDGGGNVHLNQMMTATFAGSILIGYLLSLP